MRKIARQRWIPVLTSLRRAVDAFGVEAISSNDTGFAAMHGALAAMLGIAGTYASARPKGWTALLTYRPPNRENGFSSALSIAFIPEEEDGKAA